MVVHVSLRIYVLKGVIRICFIFGSFLVCKYVDLLQSKRVYPCSKSIPVDLGKYYIGNHCLSHDTFMRFGFFYNCRY